jgi:hypothetical protein
LAFCCFGLLYRRDRLEAIINVLPEIRRREIRERLAEVSGRPRSEWVEQLKALRQADVAETIRCCGPFGNVTWEALPVPLQRWLSARDRGSNGRENH